MGKGRNSHTGTNGFSLNLRSNFPPHDSMGMPFASTAKAGLDVGAALMIEGSAARKVVPLRVGSKHRMKLWSTGSQRLLSRGVWFSG